MTDWSERPRWPCIVIGQLGMACYPLTPLSCQLTHSHSFTPAAWVLCCLNMWVFHITTADWQKANHTSPLEPPVSITVNELSSTLLPALLFLSLNERGIKQKIRKDFSFCLCSLCSVFFTFCLSLMHTFAHQQQHAGHWCFEVCVLPNLK